MSTAPTNNLCNYRYLCNEMVGLFSEGAALFSGCHAERGRNDSSHAHVQ